MARSNQRGGKSFRLQPALVGGNLKRGPDCVSVAFLHTVNQHSEGTRLSKRYPKPVQVADDELSHSVKRVMKALHDFHPILKPLVNLIDIVRIDIEIDFPAALRAGPAALVEHNLTISE